ncbi:MAG: hypothetical protein H6891_08565 [Brucellaceae bacterium]|nr:hypothetical protein [Brucellaceae bacterium]
MDWLRQLDRASGANGRLRHLTCTPSIESSPSTLGGQYIGITWRIWTQILPAGVRAARHQLMLAHRVTDRLQATSHNFAAKFLAIDYTRLMVTLQSTSMVKATTDLDFWHGFLRFQRSF